LFLKKYRRLNNIIEIISPATGEASMILSGGACDEFFDVLLVFLTDFAGSYGRIMVSRKYTRIWINFHV